jgi:hypothetical protein
MIESQPTPTVVITAQPPQAQLPQSLPPRAAPQPLPPPVATYPPVNMTVGSACNCDFDCDTHGGRHGHHEKPCCVPEHYCKEITKWVYRSDCEPFCLVHGCHTTAHGCGSCADGTCVGHTRRFLLKKPCVTVVDAIKCVPQTPVCVIPAVPCAAAPVVPGVAVPVRAPAARIVPGVAAPVSAQAVHPASDSIDEIFRQMPNSR